MRPATLSFVLGATLVVHGTAQPRFRWAPEEPIRFWIQSDGVAPWAPELVRKAVKTWVEASQGSLRFQEVASPAERGIRVGFGPRERNFGEAYPTVDKKSGLIVGADLLLSQDSPGDHLHKRIVVYLTALHELGHALGLSHTDDFDSIMYRFRQSTDPGRYFLRYRKLLQSDEDIGESDATGLFPVDVRALKARYP